MVSKLAIDRGKAASVLGRRLNRWPADIVSTATRPTFCAQVSGGPLLIATGVSAPLSPILLSPRGRTAHPWRLGPEEGRGGDRVSYALNAGTGPSSDRYASLQGFLPLESAIPRPRS